MAMSQEKRNILTDNRIKLLDDIEYGPEFMAFFLRDRVLTKEMYARITEPPNYTRKVRVTKLIDILPTRGAVAFECLIEALVETNQEHIANLLDPTNARLRFDEVDSAENMGGTNADVLVQRINTYFEDTTRNEPVVQSGTRNEKMAEKIKNASKAYKMEKGSHGTALIISFPGGKSDKDAGLLDMLFGGLGFKTKKITSPETSNALLDKLKVEANQIKKDDEAFVLVVLGCPANFPKMKVKEIFNGNKCSSLMLKPVLFFLQKLEGEATMQINHDTTDSANAGSADGSQHRLAVSWADKRHSTGISEAVACLVFTFAELARYLSLNGLLYMVSSVLEKMKVGARLETDSTLKAAQFYFLYPPPPIKEKQKS